MQLQLQGPSLTDSSLYTPPPRTAVAALKDKKQDTGSMQPILYWTECILSCSTVVGWGVPVWWAHPTPRPKSVCLSQQLTSVEPS